MQQPIEIATNGPQVAETMASLGRAILDIVTASAPLGGPVLAGIEAVADVVSAIADSDLGTPIMAGVAALALFNRTMAITRTMTAGGGPIAGMLETRKGNATGALKGARADIAALGASWATAGARTERESARINKATASLRGNLATLAKEGARVAGPVAAIGVLSTGAADGIGLTNTAALGLAGSMAGPWGTALGAASGLLLDVKAAGDQTADTFERLDAAVTTGNLEAIAEQVGKAQDKLDEIEGFSLREVLGNIEFKIPFTNTFRDQQKEVDGWRESVVAARDVLNQAGPLGTVGWIAGLGDSLDGIGTGADNAATSLAGFTRELSLANNALNRQASVDSYRQSLLAMRDALKKNGPGLSEFTKRGLENRAALRTVASTALEASKNISNIGAKSNFLDRARTDFVAVAQAAGATRAEARRLADEFGLINRIQVRPKVEEQGSVAARRRVKELQGEIDRIRGRIAQMGEKGAAAARVRIAALQSEINALRDRSVTITTVRATVFTTRGGNTGTARPAADGGQVFARFPGETTGARDDTIPAVLSHREFVQPVAAVNHYGERFMEDVRTRRLPRPVGYADGGLALRGIPSTASPSRTVGGLTITFPAPSVTKASLVAAQGIAAAAAKTSRSTREVKQANLEILRQRQRIAQVQRSLNEREEYGKPIGKGKNKRRRTRLVLRGLDRDVARAELAEEKRNLTDLRNRTDEVTQAIEALREKRQDAREALLSTGSIFDRGASARGAVTSVQRRIADMAKYGSVVARLRKAKASKAVLMQIVDVAQSGDFRSAIRLGESLLSQPALLGELNASLATFSAVSSNVAQLTTDPRLGNGTWRPGGSVVSQRAVDVQVRALDVSAVSGEITRLVRHEVTTALSALST